MNKTSEIIGGKMNNNYASTSRMKIIVGAITFEIEGTEALVKDGMNYAKENILTESVREIAKQLPVGGKEAPIEVVTEAPRIDTFYKEKDPRSDMERVTVLTYYAKEFRNISEISEAILGPLFNETGVRLPKNVGQAIRNAARKQYGYLESAGKAGFYRITNAGINLVMHQLPRTKK